MPPPRSFPTERYPIAREPDSTKKPHFAQKPIAFHTRGQPSKIGTFSKQIPNISPSSSRNYPEGIFLQCAAGSQPCDIYPCLWQWRRLWYRVEFLAPRLLDPSECRIGRR